MTIRCRWFGHRWRIASHIRYLGVSRPTGWACARGTCTAVVPGTQRPDRRNP